MDETVGLGLARVTTHETSPPGSLAVPGPAATDRPRRISTEAQPLASARRGVGTSRRSTSWTVDDARVRGTNGGRARERQWIY